MKRILFTTGCLVLLAFRVSSAESGTIIDKETVRSQIRVFRQDPLSPQGRAAGEIVRRFAENSDTLVIKVGTKVAPFINNVKLTPEDRALFLDAFVIGSVDSQLLRNEKKDDPYGGVTEVIQVYQLCQKKAPGFEVPEIEDLIAKEKRGELKKYVETP